MWSNGDQAIFHAMMAPAPSADFAHGRFHREMQCRTAGCSYQVAGRMSDDGINWDAPVVLITTAVNANGTVYGTAWIDIPAAFTTVRAFFQLGVLVDGTTAGVNELCVAALRADVKDQ